MHRGDDASATNGPLHRGGLRCRKAGGQRQGITGSDPPRLISLSVKLV
jgi:hypothetical protein